jgi:hypothetical protein
MLRKGLIEIQIELLTKALAKILLLKNEGDFAGALSEIRGASQRVAGWDTLFLVRLTDDSLIEQMNSEGRTDAGRCIVVARLMQEQGDIYHLQGQEKAALLFHQKALLLTLEAVVQEAKLRNDENAAAIETLLSQVPATFRTPAIVSRLANYVNED